MERESKLRAIIRSEPKGQSDGLVSTAQLASTSQSKSESKEGLSESKNADGDAKSESKNVPIGPASSVGDLEAASKKRSKSGRPGLPMWALTEDKAAQVTTAVEEDELDDLLEFAKNLGRYAVLCHL